MKQGRADSSRAGQQHPDPKPQAASPAGVGQIGLAQAKRQAVEPVFPGGPAGPKGQDSKAAATHPSGSQGKH